MMNDNTVKQRPLYIPYAGTTLLDLPLLNKGSAFTAEERQVLIYMVYYHMPLKVLKNRHSVRINSLVLSMMKLINISICVTFKTPMKRFSIIYLNSI